jgi:hypothetical protein
MHVCDINMKEPDRIALELLAPRLVPGHTRQARNVMPLLAAVQR